MGLPVILTPQALEDLRGIVGYVAQDSGARAVDFGNRLIDRALKVGDFPNAGRMVHRIGAPRRGDRGRPGVPLLPQSSGILYSSL